MATQKPTPAASVISKQEKASIASQVIAEMKDREFRELCERENLARETSYAIIVGGAVRPHRPRTKRSTGPHLPPGALIFPGTLEEPLTIVETNPGDMPEPLTNTFGGVTETWGIPISVEQLRERDLSTDKDGVRYLEAAAPYRGSASLGQSVSSRSRELEGEIGVLETALAKAKAALVDNEKLLAEVAASSTSLHEKLETWIAGTGRSEASLQAAAALLTRKPEVPAGRSGAFRGPETILSNQPVPLKAEEFLGCS